MLGLWQKHRPIRRSRGLGNLIPPCVLGLLIVPAISLWENITNFRNVSIKTLRKNISVHALLALLRAFIFHHQAAMLTIYQVKITRLGLAIFKHVTNASGF